MSRLAPTAEAVEMIRRTVPIARLGRPGDLASACLLLASPLAGYITGAVLPVDGGWALGGASWPWANWPKAAEVPARPGDSLGTAGAHGPSPQRLPAATSGWRCPRLEGAREPVDQDVDRLG